MDAATTIGLICFFIVGAAVAVWVICYTPRLDRFDQD